MTSPAKLLETFAPDHYDLKIDINEKQNIFSGSVAITGTILKGKNTIGLHSKDLEITYVSINNELASFSYEGDEIKISMPENSVGVHTVFLRFHGKITDAMHGIYPCYYTHKGKKHRVFATQFESHHAREVFPCVDEPAAKATFKLELTTQPKLVVLSNMPLAEQKIRSHRMQSTFETTPRMSTYLLAFVVGDMQKKVTQTKNGTEVRVWSTVAQPSESLDFALGCARKALEFYEDYFGTPYPLPKCDHVALPDFSSGAMENWGLITYREIALLVDPEHSSIDHKHHVALVIAHELAHQWFGNLVTMKWWNDLWLNESFANMMEYLAIDALFPEWNIWLQFSTNEAIAALRRDSIDGVQAIQVDVSSPDEIDSLFDPAIVYAKGGRLLRMVQNYIGEEAFRKGLRTYFSKYAYKNTVGDDLWDALEEASGKKIKYIMNKWISQPGYPVVTLRRTDEVVNVSQKQFFIGPYQEKNRLWPVPLDSSDANAPILLESTAIEFSSALPIRLNVKDSAHFITHYDKLSRDELLDSVRNGSLDTLGRLQFLHEATLLSRGGVLSSSQLISMLQSYIDERHEGVWDIISLAIADLRKFVENDLIAEQKLRSFSAWLSKAHYEELGWDHVINESENDTKLRSTVIGMTLYGENKNAIDKSFALFESRDTTAIDPELRSLVFSAVVRHGDTTIVDHLINQYKTTHSSELQHDICIGVTSSKDPEVIRRLMDLIMDGSVVKPQDVYLWFALLIRSKDSRSIAWEWLRNNWEWIVKTFEGDKSFDNFPRYASGALATRKQQDEYKDFFTPMQNIASLNRVITVGLSEIEGRISLVERDKDTVVSELLGLNLR